MVFRIYVEKKKGLDNEAAELREELKSLIGIKGLKDVRILNRYDAEGLTEQLFNEGVRTVFSEPQTDVTYTELPVWEGKVFAVEYLPGQFDQRADSAAQCLQIVSCGERPTIKTAKVYLLSGELTEEEISAVKKYVINPVEAREATLEKPQTLAVKCVPPEKVKVIDGFRSFDENQLKDFIAEYGLAMDADDIAFCKNYFIREMRDPTVTEIKMIDTYWSDH